MNLPPNAFQPFRTSFFPSEATTGGPPLICVVGFSGSGKTKVLTGLVAEWKSRGYRVGTIKHHGHRSDIEPAGKDSWSHRRAGAEITIVSSPTQVGVTMDADHDHHPLELLPFLREMDLVLVEGFKRARLPKIEVFRPENRHPPACKGDPNLTALVCDVQLDWGVPRFVSSDFKGIADFLSSGLLGETEKQTTDCQKAVC